MPDVEYTNNEEKKAKRAIAKLLTVHKQICAGEKFHVGDVAASMALLNPLLPEEWRFQMSQTMRELLRSKSGN